LEISTTEQLHPTGRRSPAIRFDFPSEPQHPAYRAGCEPQDNHPEHKEEGSLKNDKKAGRNIAPPIEN
jgi:hypothetical protein